MQHVAFLRAINVDGHRTMAMAHLTSAFQVAGCTSVRTVIQSGNVLFEPPEPAAGAIDGVRARLQAQFGSDLVLFFRRLTDIDALLRLNPFRTLPRDRRLKLYVAFLAGKPGSQVRLPIVSAKDRLEAIALRKTEAFIVSRRKPNGFYGFPNNFIEKELGLAATTRNWSTIVRIAQIARGD